MDVNTRIEELKSELDKAKKSYIETTEALKKLEITISAISFAISELKKVGDDNG